MELVRSKSWNLMVTLCLLDLSGSLILLKGGAHHSRAGKVAKNTSAPSSYHGWRACRLLCNMLHRLLVLSVEGLSQFVKLIIALVPCIIIKVIIVVVIFTVFIFLGFGS